MTRTAGPILLVCFLASACSGDTSGDGSRDAGDVNDAAYDTAREAAHDAPDGEPLACVPGEHQDCELGRPCPGVASCLEDGSGFGVCGCASCEFALATGVCSWSLNTLGVVSANPAFLSLKLELGGVKQDVFSVSSAAACAPAGGWYLVGDGLQLCAATCDLVNGGAEPLLFLGCG